MASVTEPLQPRQELEVQGRVGEPLVLPVGSGGDETFRWTLELPEEVVETAGAPDGRLCVVVARPGSYVVVATLQEPGATTPMTVLPIRTTVS